MVDDTSSEDLSALDARLKAARGREEQEAPEAVDRSGMAPAMKIGVELAVAVAVITYLGYLADGYFDTAPIGIIAGVLLGFVAGIRNVMREANKMHSEAATEDE